MMAFTVNKNRRTAHAPTEQSQFDAYEAANYQQPADPALQARREVGEDVILVKMVYNITVRN